MFVLATIIAPFARSLVMAVASNGLTYPARILEGQVVGRPRDAMLSLMATGTPVSKPSGVLSRRCLIASASSRLAPSSEGRKMVSPSGPAPISLARAHDARIMSDGDAPPGRLL